MYIDDLRTPIEEFDVIVRSYDEAIAIFKRYGVCEYISFDHDLGVDKNNKPLKSGFDIAKWLIKHDKNHTYKIPSNFTYKVHSQNPIGKKNIILLLDSYLQ